MNLDGKRVLLTRPRAQAQEFASTLLAEGAQSIFFPVIDIASPDDFSVLDSAIRNLEGYDLLVLTSANGVDAFFKRLDFLGLKKIPVRLSVAAVGAKTAKYLSEHGIRIDYVPNEYLAEAMLPGFGKSIFEKRFLFPQSNLASTALAHGIRSAGGLVTEAVAYCTVPNEPDQSALDELRAGVDVVTFTSPSIVKNFITIVRNNGLDPGDLPGNPLCACIGPVTEQAAKEAGFPNLIVAKESTADGLLIILHSLEVI